MGLFTSTVNVPAGNVRFPAVPLAKETARVFAALTREFTILTKVATAEFEVTVTWSPTWSPGTVKVCSAEVVRAVWTGVRVTVNRNVLCTFP
jgi:hypothetical protein